MYRTLIIALASTTVSFGVADAQVAGSVTGNVNTTLEHSRIMVDPHTGRALSRIEVIRAQRAARLARRQTGEVLNEDAITTPEAPLSAALLDEAGAQVTASGEDVAPSDTTAADFSGLPALEPVEVLPLAVIAEAPEMRIATPNPTVTVSAPATIVTPSSPRPAYARREVVYREPVQPGARRETASSTAAPTPPVAEAEPAQAWPVVLSESAPAARTPAPWIVLLLAGLTIASVIFAARQASRRNPAA